MPIKWKKNRRLRPQVILNKLESMRVKSEDQSIFYSGFEIENILPALHSMLDLPVVSSEIDTYSLIWEGLAKSTSKSLTTDGFLEILNRLLSDKLSKKDEIYHFLSTVSVSHVNSLRSIECLGNRIYFSKKIFPKNFLKTRNLQIEDWGDVAEKTPSNYQNLTIQVRAKNPEAAFSKSFRSIDLLRALWCSQLNPQLKISFGHVAYEPINVIRMGSIHTLHRPDGSSAVDGIWFDPIFTKARPFEFLDPVKLHSNCNKALRQIAKCAYREAIISALIRFARALDERDPNTAFLKLWGAFESLSSTANADYERLVNQCAFLFSDRDYHLQMLEHLRLYRNSTVHVGEESSRARNYCYQLQFYFMRLAWFHINNASKFRSLEECNFFLESPTERIELKRQIHLRRQALKFRS